jgi:hypothetical protein
MLGERGEGGDGQEQQASNDDDGAEQIAAEGVC